MSTHETTQRERVRVFATGACEGFEKLRESLAGHPEIELVGASANVDDGAAALAGGHLDAVLHATRSASLPADELAAIREHTRAPVLVVASSGSSRMLEEALDSEVADVLLLPQLSDAHDDIGDQREYEEDQQHPRDALKRLDHCPIDLQHPALRRQPNRLSVLFKSRRRDISLQLINPHSG